MQVLRRKFLLYLNANFFITESVANSNSSAPAGFGYHCAGPSFILRVPLCQKLELYYLGYLP